MARSPAATQKADIPFVAVTAPNRAPMFHDLLTADQIGTVADAISDFYRS